MDRRLFLKVAGAGMGGFLLPKAFPGFAGAQSRRMTLATGPVGSPLPLHPGAVKYYQEKGVKIPG